MDLRFRAEAAADLEGARRWYDAQASGLGADFGRAFWATAELIQRLPDAFPAVHGKVRRALIARFPYAVYYQPVAENVIDVLACLHTRRNPREWKRRG